MEANNVYRQSQGAIQNQHTGVEINTCLFKTGLSVVQRRLGPDILIVLFFAQFRWSETNMLDNCQLAMLPQSGSSEFDPR